MSPFIPGFGGGKDPLSIAVRHQVKRYAVLAVIAKIQQHIADGKVPNVIVNQAAEEGILMHGEGLQA